jgi:DNA polymerase type B, organellar and viral
LYIKKCFLFIIGEFLNSLCRACNLLAKPIMQVPLLLHNGTNYDHHLIIQGLEKGIINSINIIPKTQNSFLGMILDRKIRVLDSCQFLNSSLDSLTKNLKNEETCPDKLKEIFSYLADDPQLSPHLNILTQKLPFPYQYLTDVSVLADDKGLPPIHYFNNKLKNEDCSQDDYDLAVEIYEKLECKSFFDFLKVYQKLDVLLLSQIVMQFRKTAVKEHGLDPLYFFSIPGYSFNAALMRNRYPLEFLKSEEMVRFIERSIKGGSAYVACRQKIANNPNLGNYDPSKPCSYIQYSDLNSLYAFIMQHPLPYCDFQWLDEKEQKELQQNPHTFLKDVNLNSETGYLIECDLGVPDELHTSTQDFPFCPERLKLKYSMLSKFQKDVARKNKINLRVALKEERLLITLSDKKNYVVHALALKYYLEHGLVLKKIHRALKFKQAAFLKDFINQNIQKRTEATNSFLKFYYKLLNNSTFGLYPIFYIYY